MDNENTDKDDATEPHAPPSTSKITTIKFKIPRDLELRQTDQKDEIKKTTHRCQECNKSFSSGKALGGHISSAHVQANKDYSSKNPDFKKTTAAISPELGMYSCMLCKKSFSSNKSLFGHMRWHPERDWRGMKPPPEMKGYISDAGSSSEDREVGLGFHLTNWGTTNKRGRAGMIRDNNLQNKSELFLENLQWIKMLKSGAGESSRPRRKLNYDQDWDDELYWTAIEVLASVRREEMAAVVEEDSDKATASSPETCRSKVKTTVFNANSRSSPVTEKKSDSDGKWGELTFGIDLNRPPEKEDGGSSDHTPSN